MSGTERQTGSVTRFDEARGLGEVTRVDGVVFPFHCVSIADGSRTIEQGAPVSFATLLKLGRHEAADIRPA
jgi:cold shock CspA family protein